MSKPTIVAVLGGWGTEATIENVVFDLQYFFEVPSINMTTDLGFATHVLLFLGDDNVEENLDLLARVGRDQIVLLYVFKGSPAIEAHNSPVDAQSSM